MKYFITEQERKTLHSTCFFEFQEGQKKKYKFVFWKENSMLLHTDLFDESRLYKIIPDLKYYADTIVSKENWNIIKMLKKVLWHMKLLTNFQTGLKKISKSMIIL